MIITTTNHIEGYKIIEYKGIVFGEVVAGINFVKDFGAGIRNVFGGRSAGYEEELLQARKEALAEMEKRASTIKANAIIGMKIEYTMLGTSNSMLMVNCVGTAVVIE